MTETITRKTIQSPRGTHDILPSQVAGWRLIEEAFRDVCGRFNYKEIRTPAFEFTDLFDRTAGESSDILVTKQMFTFVAPDEQSYTLRPEGTAGTVRAYLENHLNELGPVCKLYYLGPFFRYEAPQAGRYRQFHQCGIELLGASGPESDAEILSLAHEFLKAIGISAALHLNSLGTPESRGSFLQRLREFLEPRRCELSEDSQKRLDVNPLRIFDSKDERDHAVLQGAPRLLDHLQEADPESTEHFNRLRGYLDALGIPYEIDHALVRGFDYYSRTAFEFISDKLGAQSTVLAGGRYDGLVEELGGAPTSGIGFGAGIERLLLVREAGQQATPEPPLTAFLITMGDTARAAGVRLLQQLRQAGIRIDADFVGRSLKAQMREANRQNAQFALLVGDNELAAGTVALKDMAQGTQETLSLEEAIERLTSLGIREPGSQGARETAPGNETVSSAE